MDKTILDEVKRKNKILQVCKEWVNNGIEISINDFYDIPTTLQLQEKIIAKLDELDTQKKYIICKNREEIETFLNYTNKVICKSMKYAFFMADATYFFVHVAQKMVYAYGEGSMIVEFTFGYYNLKYTVMTDRIKIYW